MRIRTKICGTTTPEDALLAAQAGADAIGLIFARSKRQVTPQQARYISLAVGAAVARVGVFMHQPLDEVLRTADAARLSSVQLHHDAQGQLGRVVSQYYPVLQVITPAELPTLPITTGVTYLLDAPQPGSGQPLDWAGLGYLPAGVWLAGGLGPENVAQAIALTRPAGVDAVSRLECQPGVKDARKVQAFLQAVQNASAELSKSYPQ